MGIRLVGECARRFAHLKPNAYKALIWMCYRTLDDPNPGKGIPAGLWFADWSELAEVALGWEIPTDTKGRDTVRNDVSKVCRELVAAGAIKKVPHPNRIDNAAYRLVLDPSQDYLNARKSQKRGRPRRTEKSVDNVLILRFEPVDSGTDPQGEIHPGGEGGIHPGAQGGIHPGGEGGIHPGGEGGIHPGPTNRNQEPTEEGTQEGTEEPVQNKPHDNKSLPSQPPARARPVDNPTSTAASWTSAIAHVRSSMAARHARPTPAPVKRPDRE